MAMTPEESLGDFERTARIWIDALGTYNDEQFNRKPSEEDWSIGQVYRHLLNTANFFQLEMADRCITGTTESNNGEKNPAGAAIFEQGGFPDMKIKVPPSPQYTPLQPESMEGVRADLTSLLIRMRRTAPLVSGADPACKADHRFFGALNAPEWYSLVGMHFSHHLRQKGRIDAWLGTTQGAESVVE